MSVYAKAIIATVIPIIGLGVTYGMYSEAQAVQIGTIATSLITLFGVYLVPNR